MNVGKKVNKVKKRLPGKVELALPVFIVIVIVSFLVGYFVGQPHTSAPKQAPDQYAAFTYDDMLVRLNDTRLQYGLKQLEDDPYLSARAQQDLQNNCPVTSHDSFRKQYEAGNFKNYNQTSEELQSGAQTPLEAINAILDSPAHRDGLIGQSWGWTKVGIGIVTSPVNCVSIILGK